jgi:hypothetical protein
MKYGNFPSATMKIETRTSGGQGHEPTHRVYEGTVDMSQEQQDKYKTIIGDGLAKITVGSDFSEKDYGNGGGVMVSVTLTCDQSDEKINAAIALANELSSRYAWHYRNMLRQQLVQAGILKP